MSAASVSYVSVKRTPREIRHRPSLVFRRDPTIRYHTAPSPCATVEEQAIACSPANTTGGPKTKDRTTAEYEMRTSYAT